MVSTGQHEPGLRGFGDVVAAHARAGRLVVQPRMGMSQPAEMRAGLLATRQAAVGTVGTITLDSYTRTGAHLAAARAIRDGAELNGYPLVARGAAATRQLLQGVVDPAFPVQVRHGSPDPVDIFAVAIEAGLTASEGGPISYCLPYSRVPLRESIQNWARGCELLASVTDQNCLPHLETFGGCLLGQLTPPGLLVAIAVLEALFFRRHGLTSVSLSYAQQTHPGQDHEAVSALRSLAREYLPGTQWHVVVYAYMGVYPFTDSGSRLLLAEAVRLAVRARAERLIVKTSAEAHRIPTVPENVAALQFAARTAVDTGLLAQPVLSCSGTAGIGIHTEARRLIEAVLGLHPDLDEALALAFEAGVLDIPYCLHPDNRGASSSYLDSSGRLQWAEAGAMPIVLAAERRGQPPGSAELLAALSFIQRRYDDDRARPVIA